MTKEPDLKCKDRKINYIEFPASDIDAVQKFYETCFGWKFVSYGDDYVSFDDGKLTGGFFQCDKVSTTENGAVLVVLYATDLAAVQHKIMDNGGSLVKETFSFPGGRRFHFADPHGNELAVWSDN